MGLNTMIYHKHYTITWNNDEPWRCDYSHGTIESIWLDFNAEPCNVIVQYRSGEQFSWSCKYMTSYIGQFGVSVSPDGEKVFVQTWETGLFCFSARTGVQIWGTKSRRGVTDIFVGDDTLTVQCHDYGMMLLSMDNGEVLRQLRPYGVWGFTAIDHRYLIANHRKWDLIEAETLEVKERFSDRTFTGNHLDYVVNHVSLREDGLICVKGGKHIYDNSSKGIKIAETLRYEHFVESEILTSERGANL